MMLKCNCAEVWRSEVMLHFLLFARGRKIPMQRNQMTHTKKACPTVDQLLRCKVVLDEKIWILKKQSVCSFFKCHIICNDSYRVRIYDLFCVWSPCYFAQGWSGKGQLDPHMFHHDSNLRHIKMQMAVLSPVIWST